MIQLHELEGKAAIVTGGSGGIGSAIIQTLRESGAVAASFDPLPPTETGTPWFCCDVRRDDSLASAVQQFYRQFEHVDIVIHAAGVSREAVIWKLSVDDWDLMHEVNLRGAFLLLRHTIPLMRQQPGGRVVLIGSINGSRGKFGTSAYSASKAGLLGLAKSVARESGRFGITVNVVEPGWVRTPLTESLPLAVREAAQAETLLGELAEMIDVASAVKFLCGPGGSRITGQILRVDAGQFLGGAI